jgi:uncharacterized protein (TIRG00374 family)
VPNRKRVLSFCLKLVFSAALLAFILISKTSVRDILHVLKTVDIGWLLVSFSLHALGLLISAYRWQILAKAQGDEVPLLFLAKSYLVGTFFNNFLPTRYGGDVVRIWDGSRYSRSLLKSSAIVIVERLTGIVVLFLFALAASLFRLEMARQIPVIWVSLIIGLVGLAAVVFFLLPPFGLLLKRIPEKGFMGKARNKLSLFRDTILLYEQRKKPFLIAILWAVLLQLNVILYYFLIGRALHLQIDFLDYFIFIPIVLLIQTIPVTINGLGLREGSYIAIFKYYGILPQTAFSFSLIEVAFGIIIGVIGGAIYVARK